MRTLIVDDSRLAAATLKRIMAKIDPTGQCDTALTGQEALYKCEQDSIDVAFLDIEMPGMNGLGLARRLRNVSPQTNVIFVTAYPEYALDAWRVQASDFLVKPTTESDVRRALENLRHPIQEGLPSGLFVRCFGSFTVFYDGEPLSFERAHTRELLAYLVDRKGALVTMGELVGILWEDQPDTASRRSQLRTYISELRRIFSEIGREDAIVRRRGRVAFHIDISECDYFGYINGYTNPLCWYRGEYMCQYSWAEETAATLDEGVLPLV